MLLMGKMCEKKTKYNCSCSGVYSQNECAKQERHHRTPRHAYPFSPANCSEAKLVTAVLRWLRKVIRAIMLPARSSPTATISNMNNIKRIPPISVAPNTSIPSIIYFTPFPCILPECVGARFIAPPTGRPALAATSSLGRGDPYKRELRMNFQGGGKPRPYYTRAWRADPCSGRGGACPRPGGRWGLAKVRAHGGDPCGCPWRDGLVPTLPARLQAFSL